MNEIVLRKVKVVDPGGPHHDSIVDILVRDGRDRKDRRTHCRRAKAREVKIDGGTCQSGLGGSARALPRSRRRVEGKASPTAWMPPPPVASPPWPCCPAPNPLPTTARASATCCASRRPSRATAAAGRHHQGLKGEQLAELHDQQQAGAVGFSDDQHTIRNARLMLLALQYSAGLGAKGLPVMVFPNDPDLAAAARCTKAP
jgi:hypothetical protein